MAEMDEVPRRPAPASQPSLLQISEDEWIVWAYRLLLGRVPEDLDTVRQHRRVPFDPMALREAFLESAEFRASRGVSDTTKTDPELLALKARFASPRPSPEAGFFIDFLGVRTRCSYLPPEYARFSGSIETPNGGGVPLHEDAEMLALLRAARDAADSMTVVELGAGWGPWLVSGAAAARKRGLPFRLIGVEASKEHLQFMRTHLADNSIDPAAHTLLLAAAGADDGVVRFPVLPDPSLDWGAAVRQSGERETIEVPCVSIETLLDDVAHVDLLHCDVQGAEGETLAAGIDVLDRKIARLTVGTHARAIEEQLHVLFAAHGWIQEHDSACGFRQIGDAMVLVSDGTQVWRNPRTATSR